MKKTLSLIVILSLALAACHNRRVFQEADDGLGLDDGATGRSGGGGGRVGGVNPPLPDPPVIVVESIKTYNEDGDLLNSRSFEYNEQGFLSKYVNFSDGDTTTQTFTYLEGNRVEVAEATDVAGEVSISNWQLDASGRSVERTRNTAAGPFREVLEYPDDQSRDPSLIQFFRDDDEDGSLDSAPYFEVSYTFDAQHRPLTQTLSGSRNESRSWEFDTHGRVQKIRIDREEGDRMIHEVVLFTYVLNADGTLRGQNIEFNRDGVRMHSSTIRISEWDSTGQMTFYRHDFEGAGGGADGTTDHNTYITYIDVPQQLWPYDIVPDMRQQLRWGETALRQIPGF